MREIGRKMLPFGGIVFALISSALFLLNTHLGIGILPDSMRYMGRNEIPYDAPLYPWLLSGLSSLGLDIEFAAKLVGAALAFINPLLIWSLLLRTTRSAAYSSCGTLVIISAPLFVALHAEVMSEPLFLFFTLCSLIALHRSFTQDRLRLIILCGIFVGLAGLTRFTAPALGAAIVVALLLDPRHPVSRRCLHAIVFAAASGGVFLSWAILSQLIEGHSTGRDLAFYGNMDASGWQAALSALTAWILPNQIPLVARIILLGTAAGGSIGVLAWYWRRGLGDPKALKLDGDLLPIVLALQFILYLAFMAAAISLEANLRFNPRYAFPAFTTTVLMLTMAVAEAAASSGRARGFRMAFAALALLVLTGNGVRTAGRTIEAYSEGIGFAGAIWKQSPIMRAVADLPAGAVIYSNGPDAVTHVTRRPAFYIPMRVTPRTGRDDPANPMQRKFERMQSVLRRGNAYVVFLDRLDWRPYLVTEAALRERLAQSNEDFRIVSRQRDGRVYELGGAR